MSDAYAVWRAAEGLAKRKTVEIVFPELAAALGSATRVSRQPLDVVAAPGEPEPDPTPPTCGYCRRDYAIARMTDDDTPTCLQCSASHGRDKRPRVRNPAWRQWVLDKRAADKAAAADPAAAWKEHERRRGRL